MVNIDWINTQAGRKESCSSVHTRAFCRTTSLIHLLFAVNVASLIYLICHCKISMLALRCAMYLLCGLCWVHVSNVCYVNAFKGYFGEWVDCFRGNPEEVANKKANWKMPRRKQQNPQPVKCKFLFLLILLAKLFETCFIPLIWFWLVFTNSEKNHRNSSCGVVLL